MKVLSWLKKRKIPYNKYNSIITINGLRISSDDIPTEEFNSRKDYILYEAYTVKKGYHWHWNSAWSLIC